MTASENLRGQFRDLLKILATPLYWLLVANATVNAVYSSFFFPLITRKSQPRARAYPKIEHMAWKGAKSREEEEHYLFIWSVILPSVGFTTSLVTGIFVNYSKKQTLVAATLIQVTRGASLNLTSASFFRPPEIPTRSSLLRVIPNSG